VSGYYDEGAPELEVRKGDAAGSLPGCDKAVICEAVMRVFARDVAGVTLPAPIAGHPALELCNTFVGWDEPETGDYLLSYRHLAVLADDLGVTPAGALPRLLAMDERDPAAADKVLRTTARLRAHLFRVLTRDAPDPADVAALRRAVAEAVAAAELVRSDDGRLVWQPGPGVTSPLHGFALAAAELVAGGAKGIGRCPGSGCGWLFLDPSGRRRWCIMAVCGNRAKARTHAQKLRAGRD
jgi:predicted RNA-binding Zn ribbon-like protein